MSDTQAPTLFDVVVMDDPDHIKHHHREVTSTVASMVVNKELQRDPTVIVCIGHDMLLRLQEAE